eukprot:282781-Karenia_brevis.AAC.1
MEKHFKGLSLEKNKARPKAASQVVRSNHTEKKMQVLRQGVARRPKSNAGQGQLHYKQTRAPAV